MISLKKARDTVIADGITKVFSFNFEIWKGSGRGQILLFIRKDDGTVIKVDEGDYTVNLNNKSIEYPAGLEKPIEAGTKLIVARYLPIVQEANFRNQEYFTPGMLEAALDYQILIAQQNADKVTDLLHGVDSLTSPESAGNMANADGSNLELLNDLDFTDKRIKPIDVDISYVAKGFDDKTLIALPAISSGGGFCYISDDRGNHWRQSEIAIPDGLILSEDPNANYFITFENVGGYIYLTETIFQDVQTSFFMWVLAPGSTAFAGGGSDITGLIQVKNITGLSVMDEKICFCANDAVYMAPLGSVTGWTSTKITTDAAEANKTVIKIIKAFGKYILIRTIGMGASGYGVSDNMETDSWTFYDAFDWNVQDLVYAFGVVVLVGDLGNRWILNNELELSELFHQAGYMGAMGPHRVIFENGLIIAAGHKNSLSESAFGLFCTNVAKAEWKNNGDTLYKQATKVPFVFSDEVVSYTQAGPFNNQYWAKVVYPIRKTGGFVKALGLERMILDAPHDNKSYVRKNGAWKSL